jgi:drug/metabolite transporter (DMT)-like permease
MAYLVFDEVLSSLAIAGMIIAIVGVAMINRTRIPA